MKKTFKVTVNNIRRKVMRSLTKNIGKSTGYDNLKPIGDLQVKRILIIRPNNRLGNLLLITPLLQEIETTFPNCRTDFFVRGFLAPILYKNYSSPDRYISLPKKPFKELIKYVASWASIKKNKYDLVINAVNSSSSGRISVQFASAKYKFYGDPVTNISHLEGHEHIAKYPVYNFREFIAKIGVQPNTQPVPLLDLKLNKEELASGKKLLDDLKGNNKPTICIFTFATGFKCHPPTWWEPFYERLQQTFPEHNIVEVLPAENVSQINFKAPSFYSKDVREIGAFIAHTKVFIGADSGIMHLASAAKVPVVGLFVNNNIETYKPYGNGSIAVDTKTTTTDECVDLVKAIIG
ncbi:lipopolysaccharide heptosyltransferase family protein [Flavobacterium sp. Sd200]|uniref:glycosyltransferase family 9 protein n=1 Tax=Flavobacterium sp. Sd200 TaxID=2692211 RepID=UPI00136DC4D1|nr:glycosyltransferase family 9 protein [Flavobacterium sp. Sd200]MXN92801.1 lipopolysaccharide heptosyltransferase family protein [Flavobacterium sp. Sd200]